MQNICFSVSLTVTNKGMLWVGRSPTNGIILSALKRFGELTAETDAIVISELDWEMMRAEKRTFPGRTVYVMVKSDKRPEDSDYFHFVASRAELIEILKRTHKEPSVTVTSFCDRPFLNLFLEHADTVCLTTVYASSAIGVPGPSLSDKEWAVIEKLPVGKQNPGDAYETEYAVYRRTASQQTLSLAC